MSERSLFSKRVTGGGPPGRLAIRRAIPSSVVPLGRQPIRSPMPGSSAY